MISFSIKKYAMVFVSIDSPDFFRKPQVYYLYMVSICVLINVLLTKKTWLIIKLY